MSQRRTAGSEAAGDALDAAGGVSDLRARIASRQSLGRSVQAALEGLIESGALPPGARLNEVALAAQLGVSRGPVREAARALEKTGLVTVILNRGAFVRSLGLEEAAQIYELNAVLFGHAAALLAGRVTPEGAATLQGTVARMDRAVAQGEREAFFADNALFHQQIAELCGNEPLRAVYMEHTRKLLLLRRRSFDAAGNMQAANAEHHRLLASILAGEAEQARRHAEAHTRAGRARFLAAIAHGSAAAEQTTMPKNTMPEGRKHHAAD